MIRIIPGNCLDVLPTLDAGSVQCCVTSPPYFGLRSYLPAGHPDKALEIGGEATPEEYVARLVDVFRGVRRVLRDDGTVWLNLGDSFGRGKRTKWSGDAARGTNAHAEVSAVGSYAAGAVLPDKQLLMIPARVAIALQDDGWYLRADNIWGKPNGMPDSTTDRTTRAHEYVFL